MARRKQPVDPRVVREGEKREKALAAFERNYCRMRRALLAMEKARRVIVRAGKNIDRFARELETKELT